MTWYNNAQIGQAVNNVAKAFGPPDASDVYAMSRAAGQKLQNQRLADYFATVDDPNAPMEFKKSIADSFLVGGGNAPGYYKIDQDNATSITNNNNDNATSRANNAADNARAFAQTRYGALSQGQATPDLPIEVARQFGLPETALAGSVGPAKPLNESEQRAQVMQTLPLEQQQRAVRSGENVETVMINGVPTVVARADAIGQPAEPKGGFTVTTDKNGNTTVTQGGSGTGKVNEWQAKFALSAAVSRDAVNSIDNAFKTGALPNGTDYQIFQLMNNTPAAVAPALVGSMSPQGQLFYQNLRSALPAQLMAQSGQAVTEQEYNRKLLELVPIPGEAPEVAQAKQRQFVAYRNVLEQLGGSATNLINQGQQPAAPEQPAAPAAPASSGNPIEDELRRRGAL